MSGGDRSHGKRQSKAGVRKGRRGKGGGRVPRKRSAESEKARLDREMEIFAALRDGKDVEVVKSEHRAKLDREKKDALDNEMSSYFAEKDDTQEKNDSNAENLETSRTTNGKANNT